MVYLNSGVLLFLGIWTVGLEVKVSHELSCGCCPTMAVVCPTNVIIDCLEMEKNINLLPIVHYSYQGDNSVLSGIFEKI